jgi:hypothetical protein
VNAIQEGALFFLTKLSRWDETDGWTHIRPVPVTVTVKRQLRGKDL